MMETQLDTALTGSDPAVSNPGPTPFWVWILVLVLGALAVLGGYTALSKNQLYLDSETARQALASDKDRLVANVSSLKQQLEQANTLKEQTDAALKQSRADTAAASTQISDLQGQVSDLQAKVKTLESGLAAAEDNAKQVTSAKDVLALYVENLKSRLDETQKKLDAALAELAQAQQQIQSQPAAPPPAGQP